MLKIMRNIKIAIGLLLFFIVHAKAQDNKMYDTKAEYIVPQEATDISPLLVGEKIPTSILLPNQRGEVVDLNKLVGEKPTILVFYRGGWCPYCSKQLSGLAEISDDLLRLGYQIIAISTDKPEGLMQSAQKGGLHYTLLSDADVAVAKQFGIAFKAPKSYWEFLPETTGGKDIDLLLPVPSVFIVSRKGKINFEYINPKYAERLKPELLKAAAAVLINDL